MSDKQKTTQEESCTPFEGLPFATMMEKMMGPARARLRLYGDDVSDDEPARYGLWLRRHDGYVQRNTGRRGNHC